MSRELAKDNYKKIVKDISLLSGHPVVTVEHVLRYVFGFVRDNIKSGELEAVRLKYLGVFGSKPGRKELLDKRNAERATRYTRGNEEHPVQDS